MDWVQDVIDFHKKFTPGIVQPLPVIPEKLQDEKYCLGFLEEEMLEIKRAMKIGNVAGVADGLADLVYVTIRAALIWGIDLREQWKEVHAANMRKVGGPIRGDGKVLKPPGWEPPDNYAALARQKPLV